MKPIERFLTWVVLLLGVAAHGSAIAWGFFDYYWWKPVYSFDGRGFIIFVYHIIFMFLVIPAVACLLDD